VTDIEPQEVVVKEEPIDSETVQRIIGIYVRDYGRLPTEDYERSHRRRLEIPHRRDNSTIAMLFQELAAIIALRPKFLGYWKGNIFVSQVGLTLNQIEWLKKMVR
jgi:hypothetical protein